MVDKQAELTLAKSKNGKEGDGWDIDFDNWTVGDMEDWMDAAQSGSFGELRGRLPSVIKATPYEIDCADADAYRNLTIKQWKVLQDKVAASLQSFLEKA